MLEYYDTLDEFEEWIAERAPVSVDMLFARGGVGLINDADHSSILYWLFVLGQVGCQAC